MSALIFLCRPTNIIFIPVIIFFDVKNIAELNDRFKYYLGRLRTILFFLIGSLLPLIPQLIFLQKSYGSFISDTYSGESFINWMHPHLIKVWFSSNNGLFTYTPFILIVLAGIITEIKKRKIENFYIAFTFFSISLICASWWNWWYGCSYGARNFVEYYALFAFPASGFLFRNRLLYKKIIVWAFVITCIVININMLYYYDGCFYGGDWDWNAYWKLYH